MSDDLDKEIYDSAVVLRKLKEDVRRGVIRDNLPPQPRWPDHLKQVQEHAWINPHQPIAWPRWPRGLWPKVSALLQKIVRRLLRWYIDPLVEAQNNFNAAAVGSLEMLHQQLASLRLELDLAGPPKAQVEHNSSTTQVRRSEPERPLGRRLRLAFFTPLSPLKTAIADHSEGLLPPMREYADIDLYIDEGYQPSNPIITEVFSIYSHREFTSHKEQYDAVLYAMGDNASFHSYIYDMMGRVPGVTILHDTTLHRFMIGRTLGSGNAQGYLEEMQYAYGAGDLRVAEQILAGYGDMLVIRYPLIERVVDQAQGIIVHNGYARQQVLNRRPGARVISIGQHFFLPPGFPKQIDRAALLAEMGLTDRFIVASFGIFVPDKRLDSCLGAFARFATTHPNATYLFVGNYMDYDLPARVRELGLEEQVVVTGWLDPIRFTELMFLADIGIHLRYPHIGGTPFSPIRMMGLGIPTIVSDIEPLAEFPEGCCLKVLPDGWEEETLLAYLELLADHTDFRHQIGRNSRRFLEHYHGADTIARQYLAFIEQVVTAESKS